MPLVLNKNIDQDTILGVWKIEENETSLLAGLQLKEHELEFISSINSGKRLLHWLSTRLLLRTMLNTSDYIDCRMDEHGKPYLVNVESEISLSHSYDYASVMISKHKKVGVDIELIKPKIKLIRQKFLSDEELALPMSTDIHRLYVCWCAKEAIYKWHGRKGLEFKRDIRIAHFEIEEEGKVMASVDLPEGKVQLEVHYFCTPDGYMLGYVVG